MHIMKTIETMLLLVFMGFVLTACGKTTEYTVTFNTNGGSEFSVLKIEGSATFSVPDEPERLGYTFSGWYSDEELTIPFSFKTKITVDIELYAKWTPILGEIDYNNITYVLNGGINHHSNPSEYNTLTNLVVFEPTKEGYAFDGWYFDASFQTPISSIGIAVGEIILYAKWIEDAIVGVLATETLPIHSNLYGNTNGNLNNLGLALYDTNLDLHYYSYGAGIYTYNPATIETTLVCTLSTGGRATYLNLDHEVLYFIDSSNGYLLSYDLVNHVFASISETENIYASRTQTWVNFIYTADVYGTVRDVLQRYSPENGSLSSQSYGIEQMNIDGTRVYYKPAGEMQIYLMNYSGNGKSNVAYLDPLDVEEMHEMVLLDVDYDNISYYGLILTVNGSKGLYTYDSINGLVKVMDASSGVMHSLNYNGTNLFVISGSGLYQISEETGVNVKIFNVSGNDGYIQIVNHWIYVGAYGSDTQYRINPDTNEIDVID